MGSVGVSHFFAQTYHVPVITRRLIGMEPFNIALIGCGTVGSGVAKLLLEHPERLAARAGRPLVLKRIVVKDPAKPRPECVPAELVTTDVRKVVDDPSIHVAVEVVGGVDWARRTVLDLLAA